MYFPTSPSTNCLQVNAVERVTFSPFDDTDELRGAL